MAGASEIGPANVLKDETESSKTLNDPVCQEIAGVKVVRSVVTLVTHILVGIVSGVAIIFSFRAGRPMGATNLHVFLCVIGYQLLMAESILCLAPDSCLSSLRLKHKRLIHWVMQIGGSGLAIAGSFIKIIDKTNHWDTLHGQYALVSLVFTVVSLVNGLAALYAHEWRRVVPGILSKVTHISCGVVAFGTSSISLIYGIDNIFFRKWITSELADTLIFIVAVLTTVIIINPFITFFQKVYRALRR